MKKAYITHVTEQYLSVAHNLATSIREFSEIPVVIYMFQKKIHIFFKIYQMYTLKLLIWI